MLARRRIQGLLIVSLSIAACSANVSPPTLTASATNMPSPTASPSASQITTSTPLWGGGRLLIRSVAPNGADVYSVINLDGTGLNTFFHDNGCGYQAVSPDFSQTAIEVRDEAQGLIDIFLADPDCSNKHHIEGAVGNEHSPTWSPDGSRLGFVSNLTGESQVFVTNSTGEGLTQVTNLVGGVAIRGWSPDGAKILFHSPVKSDGGYPVPWHLYAINVDGSGLVQLTQKAGAPFGVWSPDSMRLVLAGSDMIVVNADGSGASTLLTENEAGQMRDIDWSPDGTRLAFMAFFGNARSEIYVMDLATGKTERLTNDDKQDEDPIWSPDGEKIAYVKMVADGNREVFVMNADGSDPFQVTHLGGYDWVDRWLPDTFAP